MIDNSFRFRRTQWVHNFEYRRASKMLFILLLDTESSAASFIVVMNDSGHYCWPARAQHVTWPFSESAVRKAQRRTVLLSTALTSYTFSNWFWTFVTDSFPATRNSITTLVQNACHHTTPFRRPPAHARCSSKRNIQNQPQKKTAYTSSLFWPK